MKKISLEVKAAHSARRAKMDVAEQRLIAVGAERPKYNGSNSGELRFVARDPAYVSELRVGQSGSTVYLTINNVPIDKAVRILEILKEG